MQLALFTDVIAGDTKSPEIAAPVSNWSYSKMGAFWDCPRKFYYTYYGGRKKNAKAESLKAELNRLARLSNKHMVIGNIAHQMISTYFKVGKKGDTWDLNRLVSFALTNVNDTISYNNAFKIGVSSTIKYQKPLLKELYYNLITGSQFKEEAISLIETCLQNFFESPPFTLLRNGGLQPSSIIEGNTSFQLNSDVKVEGKVDIAFLHDGELIIADWKTGKIELEDTSLQLLGYALWAQQLDDWSFDSIQIKKAYLMSGKLEELEFSELHLDRARARILQDIELLSEMDGFGQDSIKEAFTKHIGNNCLLCPFEEVCKSH